MSANPQRQREPEPEPRPDPPTDPRPDPRPRPDPGPVSFELVARDPACAARAGLLRTPRGEVPTPVFMPVGTRASIKGVDPDAARAVGSRMILANTYHLALRPGEDVVAELGGLHAFMAWNGPVLTDSGGFQAFSLAAKARMDDDGVRFRSHLDGSLFELTPERAVAIQQALGADVAMCLDHCPALPAPKPAVADAVDRTLRWAARCREAHDRNDQALFGIVQGGPHEDLRARCAEALVAMDFPGYAIGGVSVGESPDDVRRALAASTPALPEHKPRYLMGVGRPRDLIDAVALGVDMFDCVWPTRNGRNATCMTANGQVRLRNAAHARDPRPIEEGCDCPACSRFSRAYLRHLFLADEMLGPILASLHNLAFLHRLMARARDAVLAGNYPAFRAETLAAIGA